MPPAIAYRTLADARAAAAASGGVLRAVGGAPVPAAPAPAELLADRLAATLERIGEAVALQTELLARLAPPAPAPAAPPGVPGVPGVPADAPILAPAAPTGVPGVPGVPADAPIAAPQAGPPGPFDVVLVRDARTRQVDSLQLRRPGLPSAAIEVAVVRDGARRIAELRLTRAGAVTPAVIVRVSRDRLTKSPDALSVAYP
jgi:hypothetical protein